MLSKPFGKGLNIGKHRHACERAQTLRGTLSVTFQSILTITRGVSFGHCYH